jgi:hypothetical protein
MRATVRAAFVAIGIGAMGLAGAAAGLAAPGHVLAGVAAPADAVQTVQYWGGDRCERLRRACVHKEYRGEVGEGNCRRYRNECGDD